MKKLWLLLLIVMPLQLVHSQEVHHAPTVEQCRADQKLWLSMLEQVPSRAGVAHVSYEELKGWFQVMYDCKTVDPQNASLYYNTQSD
jgi:hypothetical protein